MTIFYVDYENVHAGVDGVDKLTADDTVRVFYSPKADTMRIAFVEQALKASCKIDLISVEAGTPNALDFHLVAWLYSELPSATEEHVIVSNDHGYDAAVRMGVRLGLPQVRRVASIAEALGLPPTQLDEPAGKRRSGSRRGGSRRKGSVVEAADVVEEPVEILEAAEEPVAVVEEMPVEEVAEVPVETVAEEEATKPRRNRRRRRSVKVEAAPVEVPAPETEPVPVEVPAPEPEVALAEEPEPEPAPAEEPEPEPEPAPKPKRTRRRRSAKAEAAKADATSKVTELLAAQEITLLEDQLNVVVKAAQAAASKQEFYRTIIQKLGQKQGLSVYGQVKAMYKELVDVVCDKKD